MSILSAYSTDPQAQSLQMWAATFQGMSLGCLHVKKIPRSSHSLFSIQNLEILSLVRRELQREGFIKVFKVHIHPSCQSGDMPRLQRIIAQLGSEIMTSESEPSSWLTHCMCSCSSELMYDWAEEHCPLQRPQA